MNSFNFLAFVFVFILAQSSFSNELKSFCAKSPSAENCTEDNSNKNIKSIKEFNESIEEMAFLSPKVKALSDVLELEKQRISELEKLLNQKNSSGQAKELEDSRFATFKKLFAVTQEVEILQRKVNFCGAGKCSRAQMIELQDLLRLKQMEKVNFLSSYPLLQGEAIENLVKKNIVIENEVVVEKDAESLNKAEFVAALKKSATESLKVIDSKIQKYNKFQRFYEVSKQTQGAQGRRRNYQNAYNDIVIEVMGTVEEDQVVNDPKQAGVVCRILSFMNKEEQERVYKSMAVSSALAILPFALGPLGSMMARGGMLLRAATGLKWGVRATKSSQLGAYLGLSGAGIAKEFKGIQAQDKECSRLRAKMFSLSAENKSQSSEMKNTYDSFLKCKSDLGTMKAFAYASAAVSMGGRAYLTVTKKDAYETARQIFVQTRRPFKPTEVLTNSNLTIQERVKIFEDILGKKLTGQQIKALDDIHKHNITGEVYNLSHEQKKNVIKRLSPHFSLEDIAKGMDAGIMGKKPYKIVVDSTTGENKVVLSQKLIDSLTGKDEKPSTDKVLKALIKSFADDDKLKNLKSKDVVIEK